jgi:uncharacterized membrane protein YwaF
MKEFFGFGGYQRPAEGYLSWQHLTFATFLMVVMVVSAILLGKRNKNRPMEKKNTVLLWTALLIDGFELFKIVIISIRSEDPLAFLQMLPLFLCSIQLIAIPMAALCKGRLKEGCLDFVCIFGILGAVFGVYFAGQNYACYPVLSIDNVVSGITHAISGFASLYILISGMTSMKKQNMVITFSILIGFCVAAYTANVLIDYNYMFLMAGDGTPYDILFNLFGGHKVLYPLSVVGLFLLYITGYYLVYFAITKRSKKPALAQ